MPRNITGKKKLIPIIVGSSVFNPTNSQLVLDQWKLLVEGKSNLEPQVKGIDPMHKWGRF